MKSASQIIIVLFSFLCVATLGSAISLPQSSSSSQGMPITVDSVSKLLKRDFRQIVFVAYQHIYGTDPNFDPAAGAHCKARLVNFAHASNIALDYLIGVDYPSGQDVSMFFAFVLKQGGTGSAFSCTSGGKLAEDPKLVDIDSDGRMELLFTDDLASHGIDRSVHIWRYQNHQFEEVFKQRLLKYVDAFPYSYENHFHFSKNSIHTQLLDIAFQVSTQTTFYDSTEAITFYKQFGDVYGQEDSTIFVFNGTRYLPNKPLLDYDAPVRQYEKEQAQ